MMHIRLGTGLIAGLSLGLAACGNSGPADPSSGFPGTGVSIPGGTGAACASSLPQTSTPVTIANTGRRLAPVGRLTQVGDFPTGGRLTPDGRFYWAIDSGDGHDDATIVEIGSGRVVQRLPLPGAYGHMVFAPDGRTAYVSGESKGGGTPAGPTMGDAGDVIHVFAVDPIAGTATERTPIPLPPAMASLGGASSGNVPSSTTTFNFPVGLAITPDGKTLVAALYNSNLAAIIDVATAAVSTVAVGRYPYDVVIESSGAYAYVGNEYDGTLSKISLASKSVTTTISGLGGIPGDAEAHVEGLALDPKLGRLYAAITNRDAVAVVDTGTDTVIRLVSLKRAEGYGTSPVSLAVTPDGSTLYAANAGEDALAAIALTARGSYKAYDVIGRVPTAYYPSDVHVTPDGCNLLWTAAKGFNAGPNPQYASGTQGTPFANSGAAPYGSYVLDKLLGQVGVLGLPSDAQLAAWAPQVLAQLTPANHVAAPAATPLQAADGSASTQIKYVFYIVKENRTYDQLFGTDPRGDGDPTLEIFDDNGASGPTAGITPNAHALTRQFMLLDQFYEDSEVSVDGHLITAGAYAIDYMQKVEHPNYSGRSAPTDDDANPVTFPPTAFLFDQAARQNVSFEIYGLGEGGSEPVVSNDNRATYATVAASTDQAYSPIFGCLSGSDPGVPNTPTCTFDSGLGKAPPLALSRLDEFNLLFQAQLASGTVPRLNYLILPNDHTNGTTPGVRTPAAMAADNDLGLGQFVQVISASSIWPQTAIFVVEDDSQDGADHVDAHRAPAFVISPYALHGGAVVHTRYDQYSVVRTIESILGLKPQYVTDANATPMYELFTNTPDLTPYVALIPSHSLMELNTTKSAMAGLSARLPWTRPDAVPQELADRIIYASIFGTKHPIPRAGPNASPEEHSRSVKAFRRFHVAWSPPPPALTRNVVTDRRQASMQ